MADVSGCATWRLEAVGQRVKYHTFRVHRYRLYEAGESEECLGICEAPTTPKKCIVAPLDGDSIADLDTLIHEAMHACLWDLSEDAVDSSATDIARFLWRCGWRKENPLSD
jgi:hypothetical protein